MVNSVTYFCLLIVLVYVVQQVAGFCHGCVSDDKKCYRPGQSWKKEMDDLIYRLECEQATISSSDGTANYTYMAVVNDAECVIGGDIVSNGGTLEDSTKCKIHSCVVSNLGLTIDKVKFYTTEVPMKDCTPWPTA